MLKRMGRTVTQTIAILSVIRVADLIGMLVCLASVLPWCWPTMSHSLRSMTAVVVGLTCTVIFGLTVALANLQHVLCWLNRLGNSGLNRWLPKYHWMVGRVESFHITLRTLSGRAVLACCVTTLVAWFTMTVSAALLFGPLLHIPGNAWIHMGSALVVSLSSLVPIQGWAGLGTIEAVSVLVFTAMLPIKPQQALSYGVAIHTVQLAWTVLLFPIGLAIGRWNTVAGRRR
jgi:hypothetical protein